MFDPRSPTLHSYRHPLRSRILPQSPWIMDGPAARDEPTGPVSQGRAWGVLVHQDGASGEGTGSARGRGRKGDGSGGEAVQQTSDTWRSARHSFGVLPFGARPLWLPLYTEISFFLCVPWHPKWVANHATYPSRRPFSQLSARVQSAIRQLLRFRRLVEGPPLEDVPGGVMSETRTPQESRLVRTGSKGPASSESTALAASHHATSGICSCW
ncbi:hypothetical protein B0T25DRAFT_309702 [Lasiosphaeria hispida]|uniref:Uncharacterized protein n=1 Tax=Lasiosphaeria hispida TaxID=260671 RepID=A0AAJ0M9I4_9PEZI|nr:hypothetical protein B0T25DRAFT_309702 [Lasiosphaeria hispida]